MAEKSRSPLLDQTETKTPADERMKLVTDALAKDEESAKFLIYAGTLDGRMSLERLPQSNWEQLAADIRDLISGG